MRALLSAARRPAMLAAGAVRVLLRCCDVLNVVLKLAALHALAQAQAQALEKSEWVGRAFADRARAKTRRFQEGCPGR